MKLEGVKNNLKEDSKLISQLVSEQAIRRTDTATPGVFKTTEINGPPKIYYHR